MPAPALAKRALEPHPEVFHISGPRLQFAAKYLRIRNAHALRREAQHLQFTAPDFSAHRQFVTLPAGGSSLDCPMMFLVVMFFGSHAA